MRKSKETTIEMPDGTTRFLRQRNERLDSDRFTGDLKKVAAYYQELADRLGALNVNVEDETEYTYAAFELNYESPETDEEYQARMDIEAMVRRNKEKADEDARNKAIARRARKMKGKSLSEQEERQLLADLEKKYRAQ